MAKKSFFFDRWETVDSDPISPLENKKSTGNSFFDEWSESPTNNLDDQLPELKDFGRTGIQANVTDRLRTIPPSTRQMVEGLARPVLEERFELFNKIDSATPEEGLKIAAQEKSPIISEYFRASPERRQQMRDQASQMAIESSKSVAEAERELKAIPPNPTIARIGQLPGKDFLKEAGQAAGMLAEDPGAAIGVLIESIPFMGAMIAGQVVGGGAGAGLGAGIVEGGMATFDALRAMGVDVSDEDALIKSFRDPELLEEVKRRVGNSAGAVGFAEGLGAALAAKRIPGVSALGRVFNRSARQAAEGIAQAAGQIVLQGGVAGAGEAAKQYLNEGQVKAGDVILEAVNPLNLADIPIAVQQARQAERADQAAVTQPARPLVALGEPPIAEGSFDPSVDIQRQADRIIGSSADARLTESPLPTRFGPRPENTAVDSAPPTEFEVRAPESPVFPSIRQQLRAESRASVDAQPQPTVAEQVETPSRIGAPPQESVRQTIQTEPLTEPDLASVGEISESVSALPETSSSLDTASTPPSVIPGISERLTKIKEEVSRDPSVAEPAPSPRTLKLVPTRSEGSTGRIPDPGLEGFVEELEFQGIDPNNFNVSRQDSRGNSRMSAEDKLAILDELDLRGTDPDLITDEDIQLAIQTGDIRSIADSLERRVDDILGFAKDPPAKEPNVTPNVERQEPSEVVKEESRGSGENAASSSENKSKKSEQPISNVSDEAGPKFEEKYYGDDEPSSKFQKSESDSMYVSNVEERRAEVSEIIAEELNAAGIPGTGVVVDKILAGDQDADGRHFTDNGENFFEVALNAEDPRQTIRHEMFHALRAMGAIDANTWSQLAGYAEDKWLKQYNIEERYPELASDRDALIEEAIAEAYADWRSGVRDHGPLSRFFQALTDLLIRIGNFLRGQGFESARSLFNSIDPANATGLPSSPSVSRYAIRGDRTGLPRNFSAPIESYNYWRSMRDRSWRRYKGPANLFGTNARIVLQDKFYSVKRYQDAIQDWVRTTGGDPEYVLPPNLDIYQIESLYYGRVDSRIRSLHEKYNAEMTKLREAGVSIDEMNSYLYASHALDRNARIFMLTQRGVERFMERRRAAEIRLREHNLAMEWVSLGWITAGGSPETRSREAASLRERGLIGPGASVPRLMSEPHLARVNQLLNREPPVPIRYGSGMTDLEASEILDNFATWPEDKRNAAEEVSTWLRTELAKDLAAREASGLITDAERDLISNAFERDPETGLSSYVPLRGTEGQADDPSASQYREDFSTPRGYEVNKKEYQDALGRGDPADSVLAVIERQLEEGIVRRERSRIGQAFLRVVREFPNEDVWRIIEVDKKLVYDHENGMIREVLALPQMSKDDGFMVKENGNTFYIRIDRNSKHLLEAFHNLGSENLGSVVGTIGKATRAIARMSTQYNPEFVITNFVRDALTTFIVMSEKGLNDVRGKAFKNVFASMRGMRQHVRSSTGTSYFREVAEEFEREGGRIGSLGLSPIDERQSEIRKILMRNEAGAVPATRRSAKALIDFVEDYNTVIENALRLSTYEAVREREYAEADTPEKRAAARQKAASAARELTVNFNRKGQIGSWANALFMFYNAAIQGNMRLATAAFRSKEVRRTLYSVGALGFMFEMMNQFWGEDDEDGVPFYNKINDHVKNHNIIMMFGEDAVTIPLPYGANVAWVMGQGVARSFFETPSEDNIDVALRSMGNTTSALVNAFNPLGSTDLFQGFTPTVARPVFELYNNENWRGSPIYPEHRGYGPMPPNAERYFRSVSTPSNAFTNFVSEVTGGTPNRPGHVDWTPEAIDHLVGFYFGGAGKFASKVFDLALFKGPEALEVKSLDDISSYDIPFAGRLWRGKNPYHDKAVFYDNRDDIRRHVADVKSYRKLGDFVAARRVVKEFGPLVRLDKAAQNTGKILSRISKKRRQLEDGDLPLIKKKEELDVLDDQETDLVNRFNIQYNDAARIIRDRR